MDVTRAPERRPAKSLECTKTTDVTIEAGAQDSALLICGLEPDHDGDLHYDPVDKIWWAVPTHAA